MSARNAAKTKEKTKILTWRGMLDTRNEQHRVVIAITLAVASAVFSFTQLGFANIEIPGGSSAYIVVLLQLVALGSLLLGTIAGAAMGVFAGGVLYAHACLLPLDHYELTFVTPESSIGLLGLSGFLLGILFAIALRNDPSQGKRIAYIVIVCFLVSSIYSIGFILNAFVSLAEDLTVMDEAAATEAVVLEEVMARFLRLGDPNLQMWATTFLMSILCCIGDYIARRISAHEGAMGMRTIFNAWLAVVVALSFMAMAAVSFAVSTGDAIRDAEDEMRSEAAYLANQVEIADRRINLHKTMIHEGNLDFDSVDESIQYDLAEALEPRTILAGYRAEENGIVLVTVSDKVYASDDERIPENIELDKAFVGATLQAVEDSIQTGTIQRFVLDDPAALLAFAEHRNLEDADSQVKPSLAYLYAVQVADVIKGKDGKGVDLDQKVILIRSSDQVFAKRSTIMVWMTLSELALMIAVLVLIFQLLNRMIARPIDKTNDALARITAGDLEARVDAHETSEFESLSSGINSTVDTLQGWIAEAESRMDAELETAKAIQESALPQVFPPYPDILRFDIYATMKAAKQVGGDFYDFFLIGGADTDAGKLGFVMADVSGKGVPAALFMMKAKTQIRDYLENGVALSDAVENANRLLCDGNEAGMFVTAWVGVLDYTTGHVDYVNAGHNPPLLWQYDGGWRWLKQKSGLPLGLFDGVPYKTHSVDCKPGDQFLLYTDGVTEAMDVDGALYGEERLEQLVNENYFLHPRRLVQAVHRDVSVHARGAEQSDDITILALEVGVPPELTATLVVPADVDELPRVNAFIHNELDRRLCPVRVQNQLDIAVEELFVNVAHYAYPDATPENPGEARVSYTYSADPPSICVDIADDGIPYNPLEKPDAVTPDNIIDVPIGGLGILMAKRSVDEMSYKRVDTSNVVSIVKKW